MLPFFFLQFLLSTKIISYLILRKEEPAIKK